MKKLFLGVLTALALAAGGTFAGTLDDVKARGNLLCGVSTGAPGFATVDDSGKDVGFDVDYCRALAAAIFGDAMAVTCSIDGAVVSELSGTCIRVIPKLRLLVFVPMEKGCDSP